MPESTLSLELPDEAATLAAGRRLARALLPPPAGAFVIHLRGGLGAGKTCLARSLLRELGVSGTVRSPTFSLLEEYQAGGLTLAHLDLYRLNEPRELESLGLRDLLVPEHVLLIEWPERGGPQTPRADLELQFLPSDQSRGLRLAAHSVAGGRVLDRFTVDTGALR